MAKKPPFPPKGGKKDKAPMGGKKAPPFKRDKPPVSPPAGGPSPNPYFDAPA